MRSSLVRHVLLVAAVATLGLVVAGTASAAKYLVVFKPGQTAQGLKAVELAGGKLVRVNKLGIGTAVSTKAGFAVRLRSFGSVDGVARQGGWRSMDLVPALRKVKGASARAQTSPGPIGGQTVPEAVAGCDAFFHFPPAATGPDPLHACQWGMHFMHATANGSYAVNRGEGAEIGIMDTGIDITHVDLAARVDASRSCSFIKPGNPTAAPQEIAPTGRSCGAAANTMWDDYQGHGTHVAGIVAADLNGIGVIGVAPKATLVALKVCTVQGYCFTQEVVDGLIEAGNLGLDVVNMSFFADPFLYNCHGRQEEQAIIKAISRAAQYAHNRGVVMVAAAGNDRQDMDHPANDADYTQPGQSTGNNCVIVPGELPWVATISSIGVRKHLASYSNYSNSKVDVTAPGGDTPQAPNPFGRILSTWTKHNPTGGVTPIRRVEDCATVTGTPPCFYYVWINGTSMASPHAAGVAALIRAANPGMPPLAVIARMQNTASPMFCTAAAEAYYGADCTGGGQTNFYGNGLVDALRALTAR